MKNLDLLIKLSAVAGWVAVSTVAAAASPSNDLFAYSVIAKGSITSTKSDYQGAAAAGGDVSLINFFVKSNLYSAGTVRVSDGYINGSVVAPSIHMTRATARQTSTSKSFAAISKVLDSKMDALSDALASMPSTAKSAPIRTGEMIEAHGLTIVTMSSELFDGGADLMIQGSSSDTLVINITGPHAAFSHSGIFLSGGIQPKNILFNFPDATDLVLTSSGSPVVDGVNIGIPGTILAPHAATHFSNALVTGGVYVASLDAVTPDDPAGLLPGGQVNNSCFAGAAVGVGCGGTPPPVPPSSCTPSAPLPPTPPLPPGE